MKFDYQSSTMLNDKTEREKKQSNQKRKKKIESTGLTC